MRPVRRLVLSRAAAVVATSQGLAELSRRVDPAPVTVIPNGVDVERFRPADRPPPEPCRFHFLGRLNEQKNVGLLLDAVDDLRRRAIAPFRLLIVGDGPLRDDLLRQARALGLDEVVEWMRWVPRESMAAIYQGAHCVVNPSHYEGMSNVVLEAMACALPVIVSDVAGNRDLVRDAQDGWVVAHDSRSALAEAMANALRARDVLRPLGEHARRSVTSGHSWDSVTSGYVQLLAGELRDAGTPRR
jgi:glycosyltransferase involved in cell wall biosynthesis